MDEGVVHWQRERVFQSGKVPIYALSTIHHDDVAAHDHAFVEIVLVQAGSGIHETHDGSTRLGPGDVLILRPGVWHAYREVERFQIYNCCFGLELLRHELSWTLDDPGVGPLLWGPRAGGGAMRFSLESSAVDALVRGHGNVLAPDGRAGPIGRLLVFLSGLAAGLPAVTDRSTGGRAIPSVVAGAVRRLESEFARVWRVEELASLAGVSAAYLTRRFTVAMGLSPMAYLARCRAEHAAARLIQTDAAIADIGAAVGWSDPVYFARCFRRHYAMSPREYRRRFRQQTA